MTWVLAFLGFAALVILHEAGHFAAAKAVGMRVERFALFFPPMIAKFRRGETEYGIGAVPLGGYVRITGMNPNEEISPEVAHRAYYRQPVWKRIVVISAGPAVNIALAFVIFWAIFVFGGVVVATDQVAGVQTSQAKAVLAPGDRLVAVDGVRGAPERLRAQITTHTCAGPARQGCRAATPARLTIERGGTERTVSVFPRFDETAQRPLVGFAFATRMDRLGPLEAGSRAITGMWSVTKTTVAAIARIFVSEKARSQVSGVVGSYETTHQTFQRSGLLDGLEVLGLISLSLAIINLFPFLPLDGGHIFWALAEKVRGRAIPFSVMERASMVGFVLVLALFAIGLTNDVGRLRGAGFGPR
jgi:regulator of sigma E protease